MRRLKPPEQQMAVDAVSLREGVFAVNARPGKNLECALELVLMNGGRALEPEEYLDREPLIIEQRDLRLPSESAIGGLVRDLTIFQYPILKRLQALSLGNLSAFQRFGRDLGKIFFVVIALAPTTLDLSADLTKYLHFHPPPMRDLHVQRISGLQC
jgi:hypothetical protein